MQPCFSSRQPDKQESELYDDVQASINIAKEVAKWRARARTISRTGAPTAVKMNEYNSRAVSVLSYKNQIVPVPWSLGKVELGLFSSIARAPPTAGRRMDWHHMRAWGCPQLVAVFIQGATARMRAAKVTVDWRPARGWLARAAAPSAPRSLALGVSAVPQLPRHLH